jgi:DNA-binding response OmpR family regulator
LRTAKYTLLDTNYTLRNTNYELRNTNKKMKRKKKHTGKILLVDDEPNILIAIDFLLKQAGYTVEKAQDGQKALDKLASFHPDVIILDVMMPELDGFETASRIRQIEELDDVKIIFLTAKGTPADRQTGYSVGGEIYITKPFDNDDLVNTIHELIEFG